MRTTVYISLLLFLFLSASADTGEYYIQKTTEKISLDGVLDEDVWKATRPITNFVMTYPEDSIPANSRTEVRMTYDETTLYISAYCYDEIEGDYVVQSLKRDFSFPVNDAFAVFIDAFSDATSGLSFAVSPYGVQRDGIVGRGGTRGVTTSWDGVWESEVSRGDGYWSCEMAIPFKTLRYSPEMGAWKINFARNDLKRNERSTWQSVPRGFNVATLSFAGELHWDNPPRKQGGKTTLVPYVAGQIFRDYTEQDSKTEYRPSLGLDAKFALTPALKMDLTIYPDFSQVDVDEQVINLDRFELSFPERRLFFIENSDMFSDIGNSRVRPFFSRRIGGVGSDPVPILGGVKLSGKVNQDWKIGVLDVQTEGVRDVDDSQNYLVATAHRRILGKSAIKAFVAHKQAFVGFRMKDEDFNSTMGTEFEFNFKDAKWTGNSYFLYSVNEEKLSDAFAYGGKVRYRTSVFSLFLGIDNIGENYIAEMGFVPRLFHTTDEGEQIRIGYMQTRTNGYYRFFRKNSNIVDYFSPTFHFDVYADNNDLSYQEHELELTFKTVFMNSSMIEAIYTRSNPRLFYNFQLSGLDTVFAPGNYMQNRFGIEYDTGKRNVLYAELGFELGQKYLGKQFDLEAALNYRQTPWGVFGLTFTRKRLYDFPREYGDATFYLVGTKVEISFNRNMFWTTFLQYNTQADNFNINSRFQWRFRPMSDFFFVFTNNYTAEEITAKDWAFVIKLNYWLDL